MYIYIYNLLCFVFPMMYFRYQFFHSDSGADRGSCPHLPRGQGMSPLHFRRCIASSGSRFNALLPPEYLCEMPRKA